jgi:hypothetical protein
VRNWTRHRGRVNHDHRGVDLRCVVGVYCDCVCRAAREIRERSMKCWHGAEASSVQEVRIADDGSVGRCGPGY